MVANARPSRTSPPADAAGTLLLVDGHSLAYRAFHALRETGLSTAAGRPTWAVQSFVSMLLRLLREEEPTHAAVAFDVSESTYRTAEYPQYKAGRADTPVEFHGQVEAIRQVLAAMRVRVVTAPDVEADDVLATLTARAREAGLDVLVSSGDRDTFQLVDDHVTVLYPKFNPRSSGPDPVRMDPAAIEERYGVPPQRYSDLAALVGESSDNLPGVPGVGPKTAAKWLVAHGDLDGVVAAVPSLAGSKAGRSLAEHLDDVLRNRRLNRLVTDVPLDVGVEDLVRVPFERAQVLAIFDELEMPRLRDRVLATQVPGAGADDEADAGARDGFAVQVQRPVGEEVAAWLAAHAARLTAVEVRGSWAAGRGDARALALAGRGEDGTASAYLDLVEADPAAEAALRAWLGDAARPKVMHDAKGPMHALRERGLPLAGLADDTALAAYLIAPDQRAYDLGDLAVRHLGRELRTAGTPADDAASAGPQHGQGELALDDDDPWTAGAEAAQALADEEAAVVRAAAVLELSAVLDGVVAERGGARLLADVELPLEPVLTAMEAVGIATDAQHLATLAADFAGAVGAAASAAYEAIGHEVNLSSPKQLQVVLFEELGLPKTRRIKTGFSTDADAVLTLSTRSDHPFLAHLLAHRDAIRLQQTVEGLVKASAEDGRVHTTYQQTVAGTGRLSSTDPNLQNIPVRTSEGARLREAFVVGEGYECLLTADYSQIEMRIMAHLSGDAGLIEAFRSGEDLHRFVGARVYGVAPSDVTGAMRSKVKAMSYGLAYGLSAFGLSKQLRIPTEESRVLMAEYFQRFGGVREYLESVVEIARAKGYTETIRGRRRYLPDLSSDDRVRREIAERAALNAGVQGSAADIVKIAMLDVDAALRKQALSSRVLLQVHDELVVEVAPGEREAVETLLRQKMAGAADLAVPLEVSVGAGASWAEAAH